MSRAIDGSKRLNRRKKILKLAKGFRGGRSKLFRPANAFVMKALSHAYVGRKLKKRDFRKLWIQRINAGTRANGMSYSKFMYGLKKAGITINRKMLSEMAIHDPEGFSALVETAKAAQ